MDLQSIRTVLFLVISIPNSTNCPPSFPSSHCLGGVNIKKIAPAVADQIENANFPFLKIYTFPPFPPCSPMPR